MKKDLGYTVRIQGDPGAERRKAILLRDGVRVASYTEQAEGALLVFTSQGEADLLTAAAARSRKGTVYSVRDFDGGYGDDDTGYGTGYGAGYGAGSATDDWRGSYYKGGTSYYNTGAAYYNSKTPEEYVADMVNAAADDMVLRTLCETMLVWQPAGKTVYRTLRFLTDVPKKDQVAQLAKMKPGATIINTRFFVKAA